MCVCTAGAQVLRKRGYVGPINSPHWIAKMVYIQSYDPASLKKLRQRTCIPLIQLIEGDAKCVMRQVQQSCLHYCTTILYGQCPSCRPIRSHGITKAPFFVACLTCLITVFPWYAPVPVLVLTGTTAISTRILGPC